MEKYEPKNIEKKWQDKWAEQAELSEAKENSTKEKFYCLDMFPYPSGAGLHVGHVENYTATDIYSRFKRLNGLNVLHPIGWDAFGLPAENFAIKNGTHPDKTTHDNIQNFIKQIKSLGISYDWSREIDTSSPQYYKWTQWFFLFLYKNGLAYKKKAKVNWCDSCMTVLANEQVEDGACERCKNQVVQKDLEQWFFKITDFIEDQEGENGKVSGLIKGLDGIDWPSSTKIAQKNWIGKSEGVEFDFAIKNSEEKLKVFTTRIDTAFGITYVVASPEHAIVQALKSQITNFDEVEKYQKESKKKTDLERMEAKEKTGVKLEGVEIVNPFNGELVPLFIGDYVLSQYGTGAVMAVPAHDERDFEFAKKYDLSIIQSISPLFKVTQGKDAVRDDAETVRRKTVVAIVKHWSDDKYFCLHWEKFDWKSFVIGGVEDGESIEDAAIRETKEETGYQNIKKVTKLGGEVHSNFFAMHKNVNRYADSECFLVELEDENFIEPNFEDVKNHTGIWVAKSELGGFVNLNIHQWYCNVFLNGENAYTDDGVLVNSGDYTDLNSDDAREKMAQWLEKEGIGKRKINYKLRDWLVSRQRYWGAPIPIIYCEKCGEVAEKEENLPVLLPTDVDFKPTGESPLVYSKTFHDVSCPKCGGSARRESDTMDTFVCSSWYYLRFADPKNEKEFASKENINKWMPVDLYMGGAEHTVLHLLYARFFTKALKKFGYVEFDEPFLKLRHQGMIMAEDGRKMSKSLGNIVNPDDVVAEFGADSLRLYEMFMGPLEEMKAWNTRNMVGLKRFLEKVWKLQTVISEQAAVNKKIQSLLHKTIKKVGEDVENFRFNTAISQMMILVNAMEKEYAKSATTNAHIRKEDYELLLIILAPFAPHMVEEIWHRMQTNAEVKTDLNGKWESIFLQDWPKFDPALMKEDEIEMVVQVNGKVRERLMVTNDITEDELRETALESEKVKVFTQGKEIKKIIVVPGKIINIVVA